MLPVDLATNNPNEQSVEGDPSSDCDTYTGGFSEKCWGWNPDIPVSDGKCLAWRYEKTTNRDKLESGDDLTVWGVVSESGSDNVKHEIVLEGARSLLSTIPACTFLVAMSATLLGAAWI